MITKTIKASCLKDYQTITIGRQMEDNHRQFVFDCSGFDEEVSSVMLVHQRSEDAAPYIAESSSTDQLTWTVTDTDTAFSGNGQAELRISFSNGLAKSVIIRTMVLRSITGDMDVPEPLQSWYDAMIEYINEHAASPEQIEAAVEAYLETHPIDAPVTSVNAKTGAVVLTAADVGALSDQTTIPTKTSDLINDSGFITSVPVTSVNGKTGAVVLSASDVNALPDTTTAASLGAYVKPAGGIPKTDLTAAVQNSLTKADTALQSAPVTSVNSKTGAVSLSASDVGALPSSYVAPVTSVDGKTGAVTIMPSGGTTGQVLTKTASGTAWQTVSGGGAVDSVNGQTGVVVLDAEDVGALPDTTVIPTKTSDLTNDSGFLTSAVTSFNGQSGAVTYTAPVISVNGQTGAVTVTDTNTTYTISISGNVITLTPSSGTAQSITLPVYTGGVS